MQLTLVPEQSQGNFDATAEQRVDPEFVKNRKPAIKTYIGTDFFRNKVVLTLEECISENNILDTELFISFPEAKETKKTNYIEDLINAFNTALFNNDAFCFICYDEESNYKFNVKLSAIREAYRPTIWRLFEEVKEFLFSAELIKDLKENTYPKVHNKHETLIYEKINSLLSENKIPEAIEFALVEMKKLTLNEQNRCDYLFAIGTVEALKLLPVENCFYGAAKFKLHINNSKDYKDVDANALNALRDLRNHFKRRASPRDPSMEATPKVYEACKAILFYKEHQEERIKRPRTLSVVSTDSYSSTNSVSTNDTLPICASPDLGLS